MTPEGQRGTERGQPQASVDGPRERILRSAYELFCRHGVHAVGVDRITTEAGVAKMSLYSHFGSKEELVVEVLKRREQLWTREWLEGEVERRGQTAEARLLAIFEVFDEWFRRDDYESCLFMNTLFEAHGRASRLGAESVTRLENVRSLVRGLAEEAGVRDADGFSRQYQMLMTGSITAAAAGDLQAATRARDVASLLLERERLGS
jgi:AcrR family transcriptional regulator